MRGVDIEKYRFDYDLTFAALTLNEDGRIYHRYGGRDERAPDHWTSESSFVSMLEKSLQEHERYSKAPNAPELKPRLEPERIPAFAKRDQGACIHCHNVHEGLQHEARDQGTWTLDDVWVYPGPKQMGFDLDRENQQLIVEVREGSPAAKAGLKVSDTLVRLGSIVLATAADVMDAANSMPMEGGQLAATFSREGIEFTTLLELSPGWKRGTPRSFAWRPLKWTLEPVPGFGGPALEEEERDSLGLSEEEFAFRIEYFVTWGPRARFGKAAGRAGLREGDVVLEVGGKCDFESGDHFHAWWRLTRKVGEIVPIRILRNGAARAINLEVLAD